MNENLKWFLFTMSSYLSIRDGSTFTLTNIGTDLFRFGKYVRGTISGISGTVLWDSTGRLVYPTTYANGSKNLVLKLTLAQMRSNNLLPPSLDNFLAATGDNYNTYDGAGPPIIQVTEYQVGVNKQLLRLKGSRGATVIEWSPSGEPISGSLDQNDRIGLFSEISNYEFILDENNCPNFSPVINQVSLETVLTATGITLLYFFTDLSLTVLEYRAAGINVWDGQGNHMTDPTLNMVDIVTNTDFINNY